MSATRFEQRRIHGEAGFTIVELLVASLIMIAITGAIFSLMNPARGAFAVQPQVSDVQQRLRVGIDTIQKDLVMAGAGTYAGPIAGSLNNFMAPVMPYKAFGDAPLSSGPGTGSISVNPSDPELGIYFRDDAISLMYVPPTPSQTTIASPMPQPSAELKVNPQPNCPPAPQAQLCGFDVGDRLIIYDQTGNWDVFNVTEVQDAAAHLQHRRQTFSAAYAIGANVTAIRTASYYHYEDPANEVYQLRYFDGWDTDLPVVDNVVDLKFQYFGNPLPPMRTNIPLADPAGPWTTYGPKPPEVGATYAGWPAGENCTFQVVGGQQVPRLAVIGAGGIGQVEITPAMLGDGPWCPEPGKVSRFDADLLRVQRVRVTIRVQAADPSMRGPAGVLFAKGGTATDGKRFVPDQEISFDISPRNMNLGR